MVERNTGGTGTGGPSAPKDPAARRIGIYMMLNAIIEASARSGGIASEEIYLEGRLVSIAQYTGGVEDPDILKLLDSCSGFRQLVHSIGVTVTTHGAKPSPILFTMENRAKPGTAATGSKISGVSPGDGTEIILLLEEHPGSPDDHVPGQFVFEFPQAGDLATASVVFYLHDGFTAPELAMEPPVDFESESYRRMIARSLFHRGSNKRLKAAIEKAKRGEDVTIAYIGGSITQGAGAKPIHTNCYAYKSYSVFRDMFGQAGGAHIHFIKAGVGGTPSELGILRYERDILRDGAAEPDIIVVEFAVNDEGDETKGICYESLVLNMLSGAARPAVILLFSVFVNDWNLQDRLSPVGLHYGLPMVSVKDAVVEQFRLTKADGNIISKRQFFYDNYHPTNEGHTVMADCLGYLFAVADRAGEDQDDPEWNKPPVIGNDFAGIRLLDRRSASGTAVIDAGGFTETDIELQLAELDDHPYGTPQFPYNWMHTSGSGTGRFKMSIRSKSLILVFKDSGSGEFGSADIRVDGQWVRTANPREINWTRCNPVLLYREDEARDHTVEIGMAPGHEDKRFTILGFGYVW